MVVDGKPFPIWFYRRVRDIGTLGEFIDSITPKNFGWDHVTKKLFYKDMKGKTYVVTFEQLK